MRKVSAVIVASFTALVLGGSAFATQQIYTELKKKESEVKCKTCHTATTPKKGSSELNDFGKEVQAAKGKDGKIDWSKVHYKSPAPGTAP